MKSCKKMFFMSPYRTQKPAVVKWDNVWYCFSTEPCCLSITESEYHRHFPWWMKCYLKQCPHQQVITRRCPAQGHLKLTEGGMWHLVQGNTLNIKPALFYWCLYHAPNFVASLDRISLREKSYAGGIKYTICLNQRTLRSRFQAC